MSKVLENNMKNLLEDPYRFYSDFRLVHRDGFVGIIIVSDDNPYEHLAKEMKEEYYHDDDSYY
jgi:hypothetical protein